MHQPKTQDRPTSSALRTPAIAPGVRAAETSKEDLRSLEQIDALLLKLSAGDRFERLGAIVQEHLLTGGKKLRARLALSAAKALGVAPGMAVPWASACELLHNATLIHDDLQDRDEYRRGTFSVWVRHGEAQAINAGDLLLMLPFVALEHVPVDGAVRWELARAIARRAEETVRGQSLEMTLLSSCRWTWEAYVEAAQGKTAALMTLPVQGAALLGDRSPGAARMLADCFRDLGLLFQLQDDIIDLFGDKGREAPGGDLREGRVSALVVAHLTRHPEEIEWLGPLLGKPRHETTDGDVSMAASRFEASGALADVLTRIATTRRRFDEAPALQAEPALAAVARDLAERSLAQVDRLFGGAR